MSGILKNRQAYLAFLVIGFKQTFAYKTDFLVSLIFRFAAAAIMIFVWTAIYLTTGVTEIGGFTLLTMYVYFFIVNAMLAMMDMDLDGNVQSDIYSGNMTTALMRPIKYFIQQVFDSLPGAIIATLFISVPLVIIAVLIAHLNVALFTILLTFIEVLIGFVILNVTFFTVGTLAVYTTNIWGASNLIYYMFQILGGAYVPLNLFPAALQGFVAFSPFQFIAYAPAATLLGIVSTSGAIQNIAVGLVWVAIISLFAVYWWKRIRRKLSFVGG
jgi:ABC-2 type transport system permease protein